jgi:L-2-hydroxycarboxylate dehydrogenase (NAD+)
MRRVPAEGLRGLYLSVARHFGADDAEARLYAECRLAADLRGKDTQGAAALALSCRLLMDGAIRFGAPVVVVQEGSGFLIIDGGHGVGEVVACRAMDRAIEKAMEAGVCTAWLRNTSDFFMASNYAMRAMRQDCVGLVMSNSAAFVAPWGGRDALFGTNPYALAVPSGSEPPIVIDASTSPISHGKAVLAARDDRPIADDLLIDENGRFIRDARAIILDPEDRDSRQRGAIASAGPKGFGWLVLVEVLAGLLSGMGASKDVGASPTAAEPSTIGQFLMAINIAALLPIERFKAQVDDLVRSIRLSRPADGFAAVLVPGERAHREAEKRRRRGVPIREEVWAEISMVAKKVGADLAQLEDKAHAATK